MTDLAGALANTDALHPFEGKDVRRSGIEIPNAAGGLQAALKIEPREFHQGDEGYIAIHYIVQKVRFEPIDRDAPAGDQMRVHVLLADEATFVDEELVGEAVRSQTERLQRAKEQAKGLAHLPTPDEVEKLDTEHEDGLHAANLVAGCPRCDEEVALKAAEDAAEKGEPAPPTSIAGRRKRGGNGGS